MKTTIAYKPYEKVIALPKEKVFKPMKQRVFWRFLMKMLSSFDLKATHFKHEKIGMDKLKVNEPCLVLMNHSSFIDLEILANILHDRSYNIVATSDSFVGIMKWVMRLIGCIPTKKFITDMNLIRDMLYCVKELKSTVVMFPEASYSFDGTATPLPDSIGRCVKMLGVPVVMIRTYGAFARQPLYNGLRKRKVDVSADVKYLLSAEEVSTKGADEIHRIINEEFSFDNFKWQQQNDICITERDRAEGLNRVLYKCPNCLREGDMIGVCALNTPESVYLLYALDIIGAIVVGYSPFDNKTRVKTDIEMTKPKMIITVDMAYSNFKDYEKALGFSSILYSPLESCSDLKLKLGYKGIQLTKGNFKLLSKSNLRTLLKQGNDIDVKRALYKQDELTDIMFTGGSSGVHKGVDLAGNGLNYVVDGMDDMFDLEPGMTHLGNIPFGHMVYGRMVMHYSLCNNLEYALTLKALPNDFYDELVRTQAHAAVGGPPHWVSLIEKSGDDFVPNSKLREGTLTNLHYATSGGEAKKASTDKAIKDALKFCGSDAILGDGLGATETWSAVMINNGKNNTPGTLGNAISNVGIKLIDPNTGKEVEKGEKGILHVSGQTVMLGYHNNKTETDKVIYYDENGTKWCNLGDYLVELETGEYKYVGRQKRNFVSGIENIYPEELEELISTLPEVREIVVTPVSDEMRQYIPSYHISIYDENLETEDFEKKLKLFVESKLSENWLPGYIEYTLEPLKRMANSKVDVEYYKKRDLEIIHKGTNDEEKYNKVLRKN